jgi:hypothetical protein
MNFNDQHRPFRRRPIDWRTADVSTCGERIDGPLADTSAVRA